MNVCPARQSTMAKGEKFLFHPSALDVKSLAINTCHLLEDSRDPSASVDPTAMQNREETMA